MTLKAECAAPAAGLDEAVAATLQAVTKLRGTVELVAPGEPAERRQGDRRRAAAWVTPKRQGTADFEFCSRAFTAVHGRFF